MSEALDERTRNEWRELGFFYKLDHKTKEWRLVGSRDGLLRFRDLLLDYVSDPRNEQPSEHDHFGPYWYLEVMTWPEAGFDDHAIRGSLDDLRRLAALVEIKLSSAQDGYRISIRDEFAIDSPYELILDVREDSFDPAAADPMLTKDASLDM